MNLRQHRFVQEYLKDANAKQAAVRAGYSPRTAHSCGPRLLANAAVIAALAEARERGAKKAQVDAAWVLERLYEHANVDIAQMVDEHGSLKALRDMPVDVRRLIAGIEVTTLPGGKGCVTKVRLMDRLRVEELIGKHVFVSAFRENVKHALEEGLAERLDEAIRRVNGGVGVEPHPREVH